MSPSNGVDRQKTPLVISIDAMGGDKGPSVVIDGIVKSLQKYPITDFIVHGDKDKLDKLISNQKTISSKCTVVHCDDVVTMDDKPSNVIRNGSSSSMWSTIESVRNKKASIAISCGNTGALMALSMVRLRKLPGVIRPAIACLWPSKNKPGLNIVLDVGADVKADAIDLSQYALMGASYARNGLNIKQPRVGLLNVGTEEHKGRPIIKQAYELINDNAIDGNYEFIIDCGKNGCFDLMHIGHLDYLSKAKDLGSKLIIGLNSSESVSRLKGPSRPINNDESRGQMLAALEFVDLVVLFSEDTPLKLINHIQPNILVKGGDYIKEKIVGAKEVEKAGGRVEIINFVDGFSTTSLVTKIQNLSKF